MPQCEDLYYGGNEMNLLLSRLGMRTRAELLSDPKTRRRRIQLRRLQFILGARCIESSSARFFLASDAALAAPPPLLPHDLSGPSWPRSRLACCAHLPSSGATLIHLTVVFPACIEAMTLSEPKDCMFYDGPCRMHRPGQMLQIFSLKLSKIPLDAGSIELYGYIATQDILNPLLNYVVNFSRNDPIIVEQGSLIEMTGPKRGIELIDTTLIEYDMRIKTGEQEKDDLQLIDGVSFIDDISTTNECAFTRRIHGDCGAIDITVSRLDDAVEATIEVYISEVRGSFSLCVGCLTSGLSHEIQLFDGAIDESCGLRRSVVAVVIDAWVDLNFKVSAGPSYGSGDAEHWCTFKAINHGWTSQLIKAEFASILVKVTWSTFPLSNM